jgi:hypothetical protein
VEAVMKACRQRRLLTGKGELRTEIDGRKLLSRPKLRVVAPSVSEYEAKPGNFLRKRIVYNRNIHILYFGSLCIAIDLNWQ